MGLGALGSEGYSKNSFRLDFIAALTVAIMIIPQGMAYAHLAGFPPIYGLYTCLTPLLIYPLVGKSPFLSVGPTAIVSILVLGGLCGFAPTYSQEYITMGLFVALLAGLFQCIMAILRLGFLVNFLSHPVISGFTSAAAVIIIVSQLKYFFGIDIERTNTVVDCCQKLCLNISDANIHTMLICGLSMLGIIILKKIVKSFPGALLMILIMSFIVFHFNLKDVKIIGEVPSGLPGISNPLLLDKDIMLKLIPLSLVIALISFVESLAIMKSLGLKNGMYTVEANKELLGLGLAKVVGAFFQAIPNTGSFSRSAINESCGAKSGWSSIIAAILIALSLLFLTQWFHYIPYAVLAAIIITAVAKLIDIKEAVHLFKTDKSDFCVLAITFLMTLTFGVQIGIISGIILSLTLIIHKVSKPELAVLGRVDEMGIYKNVKRFGEAQTDEQILILRYDDDVFFGNAEHFYNSITSEINKRSNTRILVLDLSSVSNIDSTGVQQFILLIETLRKNEIEIHITGPKGPLRDRLKSEKVYQEIGEENIHLTIEKSMQTIYSKPT